MVFRVGKIYLVFPKNILILFTSWLKQLVLYDYLFKSYKIVIHFFFLSNLLLILNDTKIIIGGSQLTEKVGVVLKDFGIVPEGV